MASPIWLGSDAQATSTAPATITTSQTTVQLVSSAGFPVPISGQQYVVRIDTTPISTVYEYCLVTVNTTGTNTLTVTRGQYGTSAQAFSAGATVSYVLTWEQLIAMFPRVDYGSGNPGVIGIGALGSTTGPPTAGTWTLGQLYVDSIGSLWMCTTAGTPGVWRNQQGLIGVNGGMFGTPPAVNAGRFFTQAGSLAFTTSSLAPRYR